jgi:cobalamin biosynthesis Co2+ chelatase CbiK
MIIKNAKYSVIFGTTINSSVECTIDGIEMSVPMDTANRHYQAILEWVEDGNTIEDAD